MDGQVTPPKRVTSPTWGPSPPCKQALSYVVDVTAELFYGVSRPILCDVTLAVMNRSRTKT